MNRHDLNLREIFNATVAGSVPEGTPVPSKERYAQLWKLADRLNRLAPRRLDDEEWCERAHAVINTIVLRLAARDFPRN